MKSIKPNKPKAMIVFYKILFPVREKRSAAVSLFPFRQISEFPTGAALLKAAELSRHCRLVYVTYRKVSEGRSFGMPYRKLGGTAVELSSLCTFVQRDFLCHRKLRPMTQKRSAGCALARRRNMSQATALGARMCQGTFFLMS